MLIINGTNEAKRQREIGAIPSDKTHHTVKGKLEKC